MHQRLFLYLAIHVLGSLLLTFCLKVSGISPTHLTQPLLWSPMFVASNHFWNLTLLFVAFLFCFWCKFYSRAHTFRPWVLYFFIEQDEFCLAKYYQSNFSPHIITVYARWKIFQKYLHYCTIRSIQALFLFCFSWY